MKTEGDIHARAVRELIYGITLNFPYGGKHFPLICAIHLSENRYRGGASGHHGRRRSVLHPRLPPKRIPLPTMRAAMAETGVGALGALAVGAVVPVGEETGALPRTPSRP
jgi:hypothetical protein